MSPRDSFWFLAGALVTVAILVTVRAWMRERPARNAREVIHSVAIPVAAALGLIGVALGIYFLLGSPESIPAAHTTATGVASTTQAQKMGQSSSNAGSLDDVTQKLAARLATNGGTDDEWKLLAQSYEYMGRTAEAKAAQNHVVSAVPAQTSSEPGMSDTGAADDDSAAGGSQMAAIADALDAPATGHASGTAEQPTAAPASASASAAAHASAAAAASATAEQATTAPASAASTGAASHSGAAQISGTVDITSKLATQAQSGATLFIYAKQPNAPGPPVAVLRVRADHWPVSFTLSDDNAMVPGRNLSNAGNVQIEARISRDGDALPRSGDLVGTVTSVNPRDGHIVRISIDRQIG
jgi:cytochrome c-type biogenesis protein CcmH